MDAEGNITVYPEKRNNKKGEYYRLAPSFHLCIHLQDRIILENIQIKLGNRGKIFYYDTNIRKECHYVIKKHDELLWLFENVFKHFPPLTQHQFKKFWVMKKYLKEKKPGKAIHFSILEDYQN